MNSAIRFTTAALFIASFAAAPAVLAQGSVERDRSGPYVSGSYGGYKSHGGEFEDENDLLGAAVGYQFSPFFALEAEYIDFGNFGEDDVEGKLKGFGLGAVGRLPLTTASACMARPGRLRPLSMLMHSTKVRPTMRYRPSWVPVWISG